MLKRKLHKALALLTSVLILCSILPISAMLSAGAGDSNIIVNGGFENGKDNWTFGSGTADIVNDANSGTNAIKLTNPGLWGSAAEQTVPVDANSEYQIVWYSKRVEGAGAFNLYVMNAAGYANLKSVSGQNWMNETSGNWVKNEYTVKTEDATSVILKFSTEASNPGSILLDDITMVKVSGEEPAPDAPVVSGKNLLVNGDFETGEIAPWDNLWGSNTVSIVEGRESTYAMQVISGEWKHVRQIIEVEPNTDYIITGWFKDAADMTLLIKDGNDSANLHQVGMSASEWTEVTLELNTGSNTSLIVSFMGNTANAKGTFDDFSMTKVGGEEPDAPAENLLVNGDFETGDIAPWDNLWGSNTVSIVEGRESTYAMQVISGEWKHVRQKIDVEPNTDYVLVGWYKDAVEMTLLVKDGNDSVNVMQAGMNAGAEWKQITAEFNSGDYTSIFVSFMGNVADSKGTFDDFQLVKKGGDQPEPDAPAENLLVNGDFETGDIAPWDNLWGSNTVSIVEGRESTYAMQVISGEWKHVRQKIDVEPNTDYILIGWYKDAVEMTLLVKDGNDSVNVMQAGMNAGAEWKQITAEFNSGDYTSIFVSFMGNVADSKGTFDDFQLVKKGGSQPDPDAPASNMVQNGDFESGSIDPWDNLWGSNQVSVVDGYNSNFAMHVVAGEWTHVRQTITVEPNTDYVISVWHKDTNGISLLVKDGADTKNVQQTGLSSTDWTKTTLEFNSGDLTSVLVSFMGTAAGVQGTFDNIVMTKKGEEPVEPDTPDVPDVPVEPTFGIVNGDFEKGDLSGWEPFQNTTISADAKKGGAYGAHLKGNGGWGGLLDQTFSVNAGKDYILTFWYKANASGANFVVKSEGNSIASHWGNATDWTKITLEFTAPTASLLLNICGGGTGVAEDVYVDDFVLVEKSGLSSELVNGDFEEGEKGWSLGASASIVDGAYAGTKALQLKNPSAWAEAALQAIAVEPGVNYVITWYSKRVEGNGPFNLIVMDGDNQNLKVVSGQNWMNETSGEWVKNEAVVASTASEMRLKFTAEASNPGIILIDSITIFKQGEEPDEPVDPSGNLVKNGDFENGKDGWNWTAPTALDTDNAYTGTASARLDLSKAWGEALTQTVKMEKNTDYVIIFYTKRVSGHGSWDLFLMDGDTINNGNVNIETTSGNRWFNQDLDAGWVKTRLEFNSGEATKAFIKFGPEEDNSGVFLLDGVGMYVAGNEPEEPDEPVIPVSGMTLTAYGVVNNRPISADKNLLTNGNFESEGGQWNVDTFATEYVSVVNDSTTMFGSKSLYFNTSALDEANKTQTVFWMDIQEDTSYVFSVWVKGAFLSEDNRGRNTIGVVDENGKFLAQGDILFLDGTRQIVPTAWDSEWHLRSVEFHSGSKTKIGIALAGWGSQMWIDDMALFEVGSGTKYVSANMGGNVNLSYDISYIGCDDEDSLIPDANMNTADKAGFWSDSHGWRNGFISFVDNPYEYGASMKYTSTGDKAATHIIKWVDVEPNTQYTFAVDIKILEDGFGKIVLLDDKKRDKVPFFTVSFDSYDYTDYENTGWRTVVTSFNTDAYDRIGIAFIDDGGEVLIDNMRFFENTAGKNVIDSYIEPPVEPDNTIPEGDDTQDPDDNQGTTDEPQDEASKPTKKPKKPKPAPAGVDPMVWVWVGVGSAVALAAAAVAIILLVNKRKKAAAAAAAAAAAEAEAPADPAPEQTAE